MFSFKDDSGFINFREYLIGLALVSQPANSEEAMKLAFQVSVKEPSKYLLNKQYVKYICCLFPSDFNSSCEDSFVENLWS